MNMHQKLLGLRILYDNFKNEEAEFALINMLKVCPDQYIELSWH